MATEKYEIIIYKLSITAFLLLFRRRNKEKEKEGMLNIPCFKIPFPH